MRTIYKHIHFVKVGEKPRTSAWEIRNNKTGSVIGEISWYATWRQYCTMPKGGTVFNNQCLRDIAGFLDKLNLLQRQKIK